MCPMAEDEGVDRLAVVRWNIQRHRAAAGLSQADLAERMTERGLKFFPQTIQKIENGSRTLRFDEAVVLTRSLKIELWELLQKPAEEYLEDEVVRFHRAQRQIEDAVKEALEAQERAAKNRVFHEAVWAASHSPTLIDLLNRLNVHLIRYPTTTLERQERWAAVLVEHDEMLEAIGQRDAVRAQHLAEEHMAAAREVRLQMMVQSPHEATPVASQGDEHDPS